jgi:hypothetical protein
MFKDKMKRWLTVGMFKELASRDDTATMTLDEARQRFVDLGDMTGYKFSQAYLGGWQQWVEMEASPTLAPYIEEWRDELEVKLRCEGLERIVTESETGHFQANKFLVDRGWSTRAAGRPSKLEVKRQVEGDKKVIAASQRFLTPLRS